MSHLDNFQHKYPSDSVESIQNARAKQYPDVYKTVLSSNQYIKSHPNRCKKGLIPEYQITENGSISLVVVNRLRH